MNSGALGQSPVKTGTTTIAVMCRDGIILGADKRATAGSMIVGKDMDKILLVSDSIAITTAGLVSDIQLLAKLSRAEIKLQEVQTLRRILVKEAANLLAGMQYRNIRYPSMVAGIVGFIMGGVDQEGLHIYEIGIDGSLTEVKEFTSDGSGSIFAIGVLEDSYKKGMSVPEGIELVRSALNVALLRDSATGNGYKIMTITKDGIKTVVDEAINTGIRK